MEIGTNSEDRCTEDEAGMEGHGTLPPNRLEKTWEAMALPLSTCSLSTRSQQHGVPREVGKSSLLGVQS